MQPIMQPVIGPPTFTSNPTNFPVGSVPASITIGATPSIYDSPQQMAMNYLTVNGFVTKNSDGTYSIKAVNDSGSAVNMPTLQSAFPNLSETQLSNLQSQHDIAVAQYNALENLKTGGFVSQSADDTYNINIINESGNLVDLAAIKAAFPTLSQTKLQEITANRYELEKQQGILEELDKAGAISVVGADVKVDVVKAIESGVPKDSIISAVGKATYDSIASKLDNQTKALDTLISGGFATKNPDGTYDISVTNKEGKSVNIDVIQAAFPNLSKSALEGIYKQYSALADSLYGTKVEAPATGVPTIIFMGPPAPGEITWYEYIKQHNATIPDPSKQIPEGSKFISQDKSTGTIKYELPNPLGLTFFNKEQQSAFTSLSPYAVVINKIDYVTTTTTPVTSVTNTQDKTIAYNIDKYLIDHPNDTAPLLALQFNKDDIKWAQARANKFIEAADAFKALPSNQQNAYIVTYFQTQAKANPWNIDLTSGKLKTAKFEDLSFEDQKGVLQYSANFLDIVGGASKDIWKTALIVPKVIEDWQSGQKPSIGKAMSVVGVGALEAGAETFGGAAGALTLGAALGVAGLTYGIDPNKSLQEQIQALNNKYDVALATPKLVTVDSSSKLIDTTFRTIGKTDVAVVSGVAPISLVDPTFRMLRRDIDVTIPAYIPRIVERGSTVYIPKKMDVQIPPITSRRIDIGTIVQVPKKMDVSNTTMIPPVIDTNKGWYVSWDSSRGATIVRERVEQGTTALPYIIGIAKGINPREHGGSANITAQTLAELDDIVYQKYSSGALSQSEYEDYKKARVKYLKRKGVITESARAEADRMWTQKQREEAAREGGAGLADAVSTTLVSTEIPETAVRDKTQQIRKVKTIKDDTIAKTKTITDTREALKQKVRLAEKAQQQSAVVTMTDTAEALKQKVWTAEQVNLAKGVLVKTAEATKVLDKPSEKEATKEAEAEAVQVKQVTQTVEATRPAEAEAEKEAEAEAVKTAEATAEEELLPKPKKKKPKPKKKKIDEKVFSEEAYKFLYGRRPSLVMHYPTGTISGSIYGGELTERRLIQVEPERKTKEGAQLASRVSVRIRGKRSNDYRGVSRTDLGITQ